MRHFGLGFAALVLAGCTINAPNATVNGSATVDANASMVVPVQLASATPSVSPVATAAPPATPSPSAFIPGAIPPVALILREDGSADCPAMETSAVTSVNVAYAGAPPEMQGTKALAVEQARNAALRACSEHRPPATPATPAPVTAAPGGDLAPTTDATSQMNARAFSIRIDPSLWGAIEPTVTEAANGKIFALGTTYQGKSARVDFYHTKATSNLILTHVLIMAAFSSTTDVFDMKVDGEPAKSVSGIINGAASRHISVFHNDVSYEITTMYASDMKYTDSVEVDRQVTDMIKSWRWK